MCYDSGFQNAPVTFCNQLVGILLFKLKGIDLLNVMICDGMLERTPTRCHHIGEPRHAASCSSVTLIENLTTGCIVFLLLCKQQAAIKEALKNQRRRVAVVRS